MKTEAPAPGRPSGREARSASPAPAGRIRSATGAALGLSAVVVVVVAFFAATYAVHRFQVPLGWDTPKYLWKTALAAHDGVTSVPGVLPPPINGSPDRPAFPVLALVAHRILGQDAFRTAEALPFASAAAIGLAVAGLVATALGRSRFEAAVIGASVGTSVVVARLAAPETYQDNLMVAAVVVAVAALTALAVSRGRGLPAPALLLGAAALVHWTFAVLFAGILVAAAAWLGRGSWRSWRSGGAGLRTPSGGLLAVAGGGTALGAAAMLGLLGASPRRVKTSSGAHAEYTLKLHRDAPAYVPWFTVPAAALGAFSLWGRTRPAPEGAGPAEGAAPGGRVPIAAAVVRAVLLAWIAGTALALVLAAAGAPIPGHRFLAFALPVPLLVALGALAVARRAWRGSGRLRAAGVVAAVAILAAAAAVSQAFWLRNRPQMHPVLDRQAASAAAYLDRAGVPEDRAVVFVANVRRNAGANVGLIGHEIRAALPAERMPYAFVYLGDPARLLAGTPTVIRPITPGVRVYDGTSWRYLRPVRPLLAEHPVVLLLSGANRDRTYARRWMSARAPVAPGVWVVRGPATARSVAAAHTSVGPVSAWAVGVGAVGLVLLLGAVGAGWARIALRGRPVFESLALAPAVGIAVLVAAGVASGRAGVSLSGAGAVTVAGASAVAGWVGAFLTRDRAGGAGPVVDQAP